MCTGPTNATQSMVKGMINDIPTSPLQLDMTSSSEGNLQASLHWVPQPVTPGTSAQIVTETFDSPRSLGTVASPLTKADSQVSGKPNLGSGCQDDSQASPPSSSLVTRNVYISGLPPHFRPKDFRKMCQAFGHIEASKLSIDDTTRPTKGYGFALFYTEESAAACIAGLNGRELCGRTLQARFSRATATPKESRAPQVPRAANGEQNRMNHSRPSRGNAFAQTPFIATSDNASPVTVMLPGGVSRQESSSSANHTQASGPAPPLVYQSVNPTTAWPMGVPVSSSYPQLVLVNGQYYTLPTAAPPSPLSYYSVLSTPMAGAGSPSGTAFGGEAFSPTSPHASFVGPQTPATTPPGPYTPIHPSAMQVPGYYFLPG